MTNALPLLGQNIIGYRLSSQGERTYVALEASTNRLLPTVFYDATEAEIDRAMALAEAAFDAFRSRASDDIASFLDAIAEGIAGLGEPLLQRAQAETGLPQARLTGELARTVNQARLFARVAREGSWVDARIDTALPDRKPVPRPDIRRMLLPIGPVVVFGASNFPLAISVAGCDTLSALAVGCPVVVKAHPSHPGTSEMVAQAIVAAAQATGMPDGVFSLLHGSDREVGLALVRHPITRAVAFTGSEQGGKALFDAAASRPEPIPVYAEMGSVNPIFLLPGALSERGAQIAEGFVQSMTLGVGQFCTQPGVVLGMAGEDLSRFIDTTAEFANRSPAATMLNKGIYGAFYSGADAFSKTEGVQTVGRSSEEDTQGNKGTAIVFATDDATFLANPLLATEVFGPSSLIVACASSEELEHIASGLKGQLSATLQGTSEDLIQHSRLVHILERKVGRLIFNGFPTGIEVCAAMHHGGPYPATTDSHFTSIGTAALLRFVRPVCYQNFAEAALPQPLRNANERKIWRLVNDRFTQDEI